MGLEAECEAQFGGESSPGRAHLEEKTLTFRGSFRLDIPLADIREAKAEKGRLAVVFENGDAVFDLGPQAEKWALKIRYPKTRIDKLGVKPGQIVSLIGLEDADFRSQLQARTEHISEGKPAPESDFIFLKVSSAQHLLILSTLRKSIRQSGSIWVLWEKGRKECNQMHVMAEAKKAGLVDVKVVSFSATLSALKLMIPKDQR